jgi:DNA gyrase/topoisomerase IV subunit A
LKRSANIKGRMGIRLRDEDELVSILTIENENQNLMVVTKNQLLVVPAGEFRKPVKRPTYGMRLVKLKENDVVTKVITQ